MTPSTPKTIQIFLPGGDPQGIRIAEITTRIVQLIEVPRSLLADFLAMPESQKVALYFLVSEAGEDDTARAYVGQTGDLRARLASHNQKKDFWQRALVLVSRTDSLTQTHGLFLEWHCLQAAKQAGRYELDNGNAGSRPHTPAPLQADCLEIFETGRTLLAALGHPIFEAVAARRASGGEDLFFCTVKGIEGRGLYTPEGFVVLAGSVGNRENVPSFTESNRRFRAKLIADGVMREEKNTVVFLKDHLFGSPSMAALALLGRTSNGWLEWKDAAGVSLRDRKRGDEPG